MVEIPVEVVTVAEMSRRKLDEAVALAKADVEALGLKNVKIQRIHNKIVVRKVRS